MPDAWNPEQYQRFRDERRQPFHDLFAMVERDESMHAVDLGCGTGELTAHLHEELGAKRTLGIDSSERMLTEAEAHVRPGLRFERRDIAAFAPSEPFDLVFSNAALHWIDDHRELMGFLRGLVADNGQLAVQVPANHDHASQRVAAEVAGEEPFRAALDGWVRRSPVLPPEEYARALARAGFVHQKVILRVYTHLLPSRDEVVEWMKGTTLTAYERRLEPELYKRFLARYGERLAEELEDARPFFFPFLRILFWGRLEA